MGRLYQLVKVSRKECIRCGCILGDHYVGGPICDVCLEDMVDKEVDNERD